MDRQNQTYQSSCIYNQKDNQIYNEIYTGNWSLIEQKKLLDSAKIIPILLTCNKTIINLNHGDEVLWPVYVTIDNLV